MTTIIITTQNESLTEMTESGTDRQISQLKAENATLKEELEYSRQMRIAAKQNEQKMAMEIEMIRNKSVEKEQKMVGEIEKAKEMEQKLKKELVNTKQREWQMAAEFVETFKLPHPPINSNPQAWTSDQLTDWLKSAGHGEVAKKLRSEEVDGASITLFTLENFQTIGLNLGPAIKMMHLIEHLKAATIKYCDCCEFIHFLQ